MWHSHKITYFQRSGYEKGVITSPSITFAVSHELLALYFIHIYKDDALYCLTVTKLFQIVMMMCYTLMPAELLFPVL